MSQISSLSSFKENFHSVSSWWGVSGMYASPGVHVEAKRQLVCIGATFHQVGPGIEHELLGLMANAFPQGATSPASFVLSTP